MFSKKLFLIFCLPFALSAQSNLTPELLLNLKRLKEPVISTDGKNCLYTVEQLNMQENKYFKDIYWIPISGGNPKQLTFDKGNEFAPAWSKDGSKINYLSDESGSPQLYEMLPDGSGKKQLTDVTDGIASFAFTNSGNLIFASDVKTSKDLHDIYPDVPKSDAKIIDDLYYRAWSSWDDYSYTHLFYALASANMIDLTNSIDLMKGETFDVEGFAVNFNSNYIAYSCKKQYGTVYAQSTDNDIYLYNIKSQTTINLSKGMPGYDMIPYFSKDGKKLAWTSMPTAGYEADITNLIIFDVENNKIEKSISGFSDAISEFVWSEDAKLIYYLSEKEGTVQLFSVDIKSEIKSQLTSGWQDYSTLSFSKNMLVMLKTTFSLPSEVVTFSLKNKEAKQLTYTNQAVLNTVKFGKVESIKIKTTDQKSLQTWVFYPPNFDPSKKYPTILYCLGGPQSAVSQSFSYRWNLQLMCSKGYIVVAPNRRGTTGFGKDWKEQISQDWGGQVMKDYRTAIDSIAMNTYVDTSKIAAVGASYGGYSVYWLAGHNQDKRFKTFIAHCGLFNLESWYPTTDQIFFGKNEFGGAYWELPKPKSYSEFSPHNFVKDWNVPVLVIHNEKDFRVPISEGMQAFGAAQLNGLKSRFLYFPDEGHWILKPQNSLVWHREFYRWLEETLH